MGFFRQAVRHPQQLWIRRFNLQVHLWIGVILAIYISLIGLTGSILVFGAELQRISDPSPWPALRSTRYVADVSVVIGNLRATYPQMRIISLMCPTAAEPVFMAVLQSHRRTTVALNAVTGQVLQEVHRRPSSLDWIYELHENLLARRTGRVINGSGAAALVLLALTGVVNWWPGIQNWRRALRVDFRRRWKRINFDLHSAVGFWSVGFVIVWAASGVYFAWPDKVLAFVDHLSPVRNALPPSVRVNPEGEIVPLDFHAMLERAYAVDPGTQWKGIVFPGTRRSPIQVLMSRSPGIGRDYEDTLYFNPYNGQYISIWQYGVNKSLGDWIIWLQIPLHFGTHWGLGVKLLWAAFGVAFPVLAVTGLLMYWNRVLARKWRGLRNTAR